MREKRKRADGDEISEEKWIRHSSSSHEIDEGKQWASQSY
jgi:hypothetical protein